MGTPEFAVPTLDALVNSGKNIVAVITSPDKFGGRGRKKVIQSAVKKYALEKELPILQPVNLKSESFISELRSYNADLQIVVAFRMLPVIVWDMPRLGTINLHASLLPKYRGAAPINWAIINGESETGLTTFFLKHKIDTGDLLFQSVVSIDDDMTAGDLHDKLMVEGAQLMLKTVAAVEQKNYQAIPQSEHDVSNAPKIFHGDCQIDFSKDARSTYNFIRGLCPYPGAWTMVDGKELKILECTLDLSIRTEPGKILIEDKTFLISTQDGAIDVKFLQMQGKKRMDVKSFLNGYEVKSDYVSIRAFST